MSDPQRLTPERLAEIRERCDATTHGDWYVRSDGWTVRTEYGEVDGLLGPKIATTYQAGVGYEEQVANADFIAGARQDIPDLLAEIDALHAERDLMALDDSDDDRFGFNQTVDPE